MTRTTNARIAGVAFLAYIVVAFTGAVLARRASSGEGMAAKLANIARHAAAMRLALVLTLIGCFCALFLAVTLYAITRDEDPDLALLILAFRTGEGVVGGVSLSTEVGRLWLATAAGSDAPDPVTTQALGAVLFRLPDGHFAVAASFFAVGSLVFSYLLLRGRMVPAVLAWVGVLASILIVVGLPLQLAGIVGSPITEAMWYPMLAFEVPLGFWLIFKGVAAPSRRQSA